ncbi:antizyme inhibitor 2 isoform X8 [Callithrix jacchus]
MVLCIANDDSHSLNRLSLKFGVPLKSCRHLLESAKKSHVEVVGVSFHVGSGCPDPQAYAQSIADARLMFEMGTELGHRMHVLDLGGGFPGTEGAKVRFEEIASVINSALDLYFPEGCGVDILAELGRYYVTSAFAVAVSITAKKEVLLDQPGREEENGSAPKTFVYHLDEGVYGIFNSVLFDNICPTPVLQKRRRLAVLPRMVSNSWAQAIISPRPPKKLGLQFSHQQVLQSLSPKYLQNPFLSFTCIFETASFSLAILEASVTINLHIHTLLLLTLALDPRLELRQGSPTPRPQMRTGLWPVRNPAAQQEMSRGWEEQNFRCIYSCSSRWPYHLTPPPVGSVVTLDSHRSVNYTCEGSRLPDPYENPMPDDLSCLPSPPDGTV